MLTLTDGAGARLADKLAKKNAGDDITMRLVHQRARKRWALKLDKASPSDVTFLHEGRLVLVLDERSSDLMKNKMLDTRDSDEGPRLRLRGD